jgi:hypothetical protein
MNNSEINPAKEKKSQNMKKPRKKLKNNTESLK